MRWLPEVNTRISLPIRSHSFARTPQHEKYKELRKKLREQGIHPAFQHEYVENDPVFSKTWHTYFSVDVIEDV